jgi:hypothetical protein
MHINVTSNLLATWHDPPGDNLIAPAASRITLEISAISSSPSRPPHMSRKPSSATLVQNAPGRPLPPLAYSLERLSIGENRLTNESIPPFTILKELRVLNLSFDETQALPPSFLRNLQKLDDFVIIGNHGLWKYVSYQTAVDIARSEASDPMIAAQKLRDFTTSYGADGNTMIMVICVADLFRFKQTPSWIPNSTALSRRRRRISLTAPSLA